MPAVALSRVGARVVESGPGGEDLAAGTWQRLEALPDPRSPRGCGVSPGHGLTQRLAGGFERISLQFRGILNGHPGFLVNPFRDVVPLEIGFGW